MLQDFFFAAYKETGPAPAPVDPEDIPVKDTYTRAEVDEIISRKLEEAVKQLSGKDVKVEPVPTDPEDVPGVDAAEE